MKEIEQVWSEYRSKLYGFIKSKVDPEDAEDILQDVFIKTYTNISSLNESAKLESWLYQITRNSITDYYRSKKNQVLIPDWLEGISIDEHELSKRELASCLSPMIDLLPHKYQTAIRLSEMEGKTQNEVAKLENISISGAKSRVQRGRLLLKDMLDECCKFQTDKNNSLISYEAKSDKCKNC